MAGRYWRAGKREKGRILDEFCAATGCSRKYALGLLRHPPAEAGPPPRRPRAWPKAYGPAEAALLRACWAVADGICAKWLAPFLGELPERLAACGTLSAV